MDDEIVMIPPNGWEETPIWLEDLDASITHLRDHIRGHVVTGDTNRMMLEELAGVAQSINAGRSWPGVPTPLELLFARALHRLAIAREPGDGQ